MCLQPLKTNYSLEVSRSVPEGPNNQNPGTRVPVRTTNGSSPGRDGTEQHLSHQALPRSTLPSNLISQTRVAAATRPDKINPTESPYSLVWTALEEGNQSVRLALNLGQD